ncbi:MAG: dienelactone hydrolase [Paracrocinitomix sp.]|jgi:dienelactone hydrolase
MAWNDSKNIGATVLERGFTLENQGRVVPGVYWTPVGHEADRVVLLGHGGAADKKADYIELIAHGLCGLGVAAVAIDGPGHGERLGAEVYKGVPAEFVDRWQSDGGTEAIVSDWRAALDFIEQHDDARATGYLGFSMGTMMGLPLCVADERIAVAVLGLMGVWGPNKDDLERRAPELSIPVRFLMQWDDEVVPRDRCLELFGAIGSKRKTLHANPGAHSAVPTFEVEAGVHYLAQQLAKIV